MGSWSQRSTARTIYRDGPSVIPSSLGSFQAHSEEARKIATAIARIPEFMMQRRRFYSRGPGNYQ